MDPSPRPHGPWHILGSRQVYGDPWITVQQDQVRRPDGQPGTHCVVTMKAGVCVVALDDQGCVHLTEEFHYGIGRLSLEGVSGGIEPGETAESTAERELAEELGIRARRWTRLGVVDPFTTIVVSPTQLYLAEDLSFGQTALEGTELIRHVTLPLAEAVRRVTTSDITHSPTAVLLLRIWLDKNIPM